MKVISKILFSRNIIQKNSTNIAKYYFSRNAFRLSIINSQNFNFLKVQKRLFAGCEKEHCGCHGNAQPEDELEKKLKALNQRVIQCINLGNFNDALELSDEYISQIKSNFGR